MGPRELAGYTLEQVLGRGGMGTVYVATHPRTGARVALKLIRQDKAGREELTRRFRREAEAMARLEHPNLVRILDAGEADGNLFIAMELVEGEDLAACLEAHGALSPEELTTLAEGLLAALEAMHGEGIVHRDLKPHNILLERGGRPLVMDLGLARVPDGVSLTETGTLIGSPRYYSPELVRGDPADARSDLYQLGMILWEAATGELAYPGTEMTELLHQIMRRPVPPLAAAAPGCPPRLAAMVDACLAKDPGSRPPSASRARAMLAVTPPRRAPPRSAGVPTAVSTEPSRRYPGRGPLALGVVLALGLAGGWWWGSGPPPPSEVRVLAGADRVRVRWRGTAAVPARLSVDSDAGDSLETPRHGYPTDLPDQADLVQLTLTGLVPDREYRVRLLHPGAPGEVLPFRTAQGLLPVREPRLFLDGPRGPGGLELALPLEAAVEVAHAGGVRRSPPASRHRLVLDGLDPLAPRPGLALTIMGPAGGRETTTLDPVHLLEGAARRFLERARSEEIRRALHDLGSTSLGDAILHTGSTLASSMEVDLLKLSDQVDRRTSAHREEVTRRSRERVRDLPSLTALEAFRPLARWFLSSPATDRDLRVRVREVLGELIFLEHCLALVDVELCPSPRDALPAPVVDTALPRPSTQLAAPVHLIPVFVHPAAGHRSDRQARIRLELPPGPARGWLEVHARLVALHDSLFMVATLPGGSRGLMLPREPKGPDGLDLTLTIPARDLTPGGGEVTLSLQDRYGLPSLREATVLEAGLRWLPAGAVDPGDLATEGGCPTSRS